MAKLVRSHSGTAFRTHSFMNYTAPEMTGIDVGAETSEYTNAVDIWALGCIAHEALTHTLPFRGLRELVSYCIDPKFPREFMLLKNISKAGVEIIERMLYLSPELRVTAVQALGSEWLRLEDEGAASPEAEGVQRQRKAHKWEELGATITSNSISVRQPLVEPLSSFPVEPPPLDWPSESPLLEKPSFIDWPSLDWLEKPLSLEGPQSLVGPSPFVEL